MTIKNCPKCGGVHTGSNECPFTEADILRMQPPLVRNPKPWERCPSTHCERRGECASPHECCVKPKPAATVHG